MTAEKPNLQTQKSQLIEPRRLKGFRDYTPDLMKIRWRLMDLIRSEAALADFRAIGTPSLEFAQTLLGHGEETDKQVYRFRDHGDRDIALRFDLTVPFARFVAEHQNDLVFPFKKIQIGDVWRGENTQKGRYREFAQCDLDIIGIDHAFADVEVLTTFALILTKMNFGPFAIAVGSRPILSSVIKHFLGDVDPSVESTTLIGIDKLAKIGVEKVADLLASQLQRPREIIAQMMALLQAKNAQGDTDLDQIIALFNSGSETPSILKDIGRLQQTIDAVRQSYVADCGMRNLKPLCRVKIDLTVARGLGYYTGVVFETTVDDLPGFGSICSGGRYDNLVSRFTTRELSGVGGSIGLDRLLAALEELGQVGDNSKKAVFVAVASSDAMDYARGILSELRSQGIVSDLGLAPKLSQQFKYADKLGYPLVITVGSEEVKNQSFAIKTMATGEQVQGLPRTRLIVEVPKRLG